MEMFTKNATAIRPVIEVVASRAGYFSPLCVIVPYLKEHPPLLVALEQKWVRDKSCIHISNHARRYNRLHLAGLDFEVHRVKVGNDADSVHLNGARATAEPATPAVYTKPQIVQRPRS